MLIKLAALIIGPDSIMIEDGTYQTFAMPGKKISTPIAMLTGITDEMVESAPSFTTVVGEFFDFIEATADAFKTTTGSKISHAIFVAHNGNTFDLPFMLCSLECNNCESLWNEHPPFGSSLDTLQIVRANICQPCPKCEAN